MGEPVTVTLSVGGMHCGSCGLLVDDALEELDGVERAETDVRRGRTVVRAHLDATSVGDMVAAVAEAGYAAAPEGG